MDPYCTVAILIFLTTSMKFAKKIYAIGANEKAARLSGIHVEGVRILVYMIAGTLVGSCIGSLSGKLKLCGPSH